MPQYFEHNTMTIKCVASISPIIWSSKKETTVVQHQQLQEFDIPPPSIDTREAMFLGRQWLIKHMTFIFIFHFLLSKI
jgi:hypothetical protein